jgi:hypothetical protein
MVTQELKDNLKHLISLHLEAKQAQDLDKLVELILALCETTPRPVRPTDGPINPMLGASLVDPKESRIPTGPSTAEVNAMKALNFEEPIRAK